MADVTVSDATIVRTAFANDTFGERGGCGFTFGNGCSGDSPADLFGQRKTTSYAVHPNRQEKLEVVE